MVVGLYNLDAVIQWRRWTETGQRWEKSRNYKWIESTREQKWAMLIYDKNIEVIQQA